jgi:hypothetical protein
VEDLAIRCRAGAVNTRRPRLREPLPGHRHRPLTPSLGVVSGAHRRRAATVAPEADRDPAGMS